MTVKTYNIIKWVFIPFFFFWCFLQNLVGFCVYIYLKCIGEAQRKKSDDNIVYFSTNQFGGVSLGYFIFLQGEDKTDVHHEWGHEIQSLILGPLYLLVIGLPSGIVSGLNLTNGNNYKYYNYPWESWADSLGKIKHENFSYNREVRC